MTGLPLPPAPASKPIRVLRAAFEAWRDGPLHRRQYVGHLARRLYLALPIRYEHKMRLRTVTARYLPGFWAYVTGKATPARKPFLALVPDFIPERVDFPKVDEPDVSIVIPIYGHIDHTMRCLASLRAQDSIYSFEVIVVDDRSPDASLTRLRACCGLEIVANDVNVGFIESCNRGAARARGRYLVFLNNDTAVLPQWLDELIGTFTVMPAAGLVGSMLIYPDGRLQEAGGLIWCDGSGWNYGRTDDPDKPEYLYLREADYCSGASLAIPTAFFRELDGFDLHYRPAYGEDSDLAFRVRQAGRRVYYQPLSKVVHYEGVSSGTDTTQGVKAHQVVNAGKLFARWQTTLASHQEPGMNVPLAVDRGTLGRVLVLDHCTPTPDQDAGSITAFNILRLLCALGYKVTFIPEDNFAFLPRYTADLQRIGVEVLYLPYVGSVKQHLDERGALYDAVLVFRVGAAVRHLDLVRTTCPRARVIFHTSDLHFLREERRVQVTGAGSRSDHDHIKALELKIMRAVDRVIVHSEVEQRLLREEGIDRVSLFSWAIEAPGTSVGFERRADVAFIGGYQHPPNVDAVLHFAHDILPLIHLELPALRFHIVGSLPPPDVRALASDRIVVTGYVPDLAPVLDAIRIAVVPLRYGAGIKGKIGTALSHGLPCVSTTMGTEGMSLEDGENVVVADDDADFARAVVQLYRDGPRWQRLSARGLEFVRRHYSFEAGLDVMAGVLASVGLPHRSVQEAAPLVPKAAAVGASQPSARDHPISTTSTGERPGVARERRSESDVVQDEFKRRLQERLALRQRVRNAQELPAIFHVWSRQHLRPKLEVVGLRGVIEVFFDQMAAACRTSPEPQRFLSLGTSPFELEVALARQLVEAGHRHFRLECLDVTDGEATTIAPEGPLGHPHLDVVAVDLRAWRPAPDGYRAVVAHNVLHRIIELETLLDRVKTAIGRRGVFVVADTIGRNGHMRWPEALEVVRELWQTMPERYKYNHLFHLVEREYVNWDCSKGTTEGIRAQDVLPLLADRFAFDTFLGFGNVIDVFIDRAFGHNLDPDSPEDCAFIDRVAELDDRLIEAGTLKPTHMVAVMQATADRAPRVYKHLTPEFCVRRAEVTPQVAQSR